MKMTMNFSQFMDNWPESRKDQFSYDALRAIFDYLEEMEEGTGEEIEFDPIAICCDFTEYDSLDDVKADYKDIEDLDDLKDNTQVMELENGGLVILQF